LRSFRPDLVISARMQSEGYLVSEAKELMGSAFTVPLIHFLWGTDIEFFGKDAAHSPTHLQPIRRTLSSCNYVLSDTHRYADQASEFGFRGVSVPTRTQTPRFCGAPLRRSGRPLSVLNAHMRSAALRFLVCRLRPPRTSWLMVGKTPSPQ